MNSLLDCLLPQRPPEPVGARLVKGAFSKPEPLTPEQRRQHAIEYHRDLRAMWRILNGKDNGSK